ncbi:MAG: transcription elongation factor GreA [Patescibacteria group bacterium]|jgi:transcription elongation factor GreA|nr:transcription elongation factor GreA [Patescibacteria group bacterium]
MTTEKEYITKEKAEALKAELNDLQSVKRREIIEALEYAKSLGDLSENAEYHQARESQAKLEERIQEINRVLKDAEVVSKKKSDSVGIGSEVEVKKKGDSKSKTFILVGEGEADMSQGKISYQSPLGEALFGAKKGDTVNFKSPVGPIEYKIIDVK